MNAVSNAGNHTRSVNLSTNTLLHIIVSFKYSNKLSIMQLNIPS